MDLFEEFEFKPLTEGLGFHHKFQQKMNKLKSEMQQNIAKEQISKELPPTSLPENNSSKFEDKNYLNFKNELNSSLNNSGLNIERPPLKKQNPISEIIKDDNDNKKEINKINIDSLFSNLSKNLDFDERDEKKKNNLSHHNKNKPLTRKKIFWSISASFIDSIIVISIMLVFLIMVLLITKVDFIPSLLNNFEPMVKISLVLLFLTIMQMYLIVARSFFNKTLGEWAFDLKLGRDSQINSSWYTLQVIFRTFLITLTGIITLPFLSFLTGKDIAGYLSGLQLHNTK